MTIPGTVQAVREVALAEGPGRLGDADLLALVGNIRPELASILNGVTEGVRALAWRSPAQLVALGCTEREAARLAAAFELGRRGAWDKPRRGARCLDPGTVHNLLRHEAMREREAFFVVLLDVRGRLIAVERVAEGSLTQCPVSPREALRPAVLHNAHGVVFAHNHPSGDPSPSPEDVDLTERLRAAAELVGVVARDHVIVAEGGYFSFVEAGRWRR